MDVRDVTVGALSFVFVLARSTAADVSSLAAAFLAARRLLFDTGVGGLRVVAAARWSSSLLESVMTERDDEGGVGCRRLLDAASFAMRRRLSASTGGEPRRAECDGAGSASS